MLRPFLNRVSGKPSKADITLFTGGLNTCDDKAMIRDNQMPYMWNMTLNKNMSMTTRSNRESLAWFLQDTTNWGSGEILKMFPTSDKTLLTIEKNGDRYEVYELKKTSNYLTKDFIGLVETATFYSITECRNSSTKYFYIATNRKLYQIEKTSSTETLTDVTSASNSACGILAYHKNRLWVGNGVSLKFSALREYTDFMSNYNVDSVTGDTSYFTVNKATFLSGLSAQGLNVGLYRIIATNNAGVIDLSSSYYDQAGAYWATSPSVPTAAFGTTGIQDGETKEIYLTVGSDSTAGEIQITNANGDIKALIPYDDKLIIMCERSMHLLYGDSPMSEVNQFTVVDLNNGIGCISDETVTICNKILYWLDTDMSVYRYNGSSITKISEPYGGDNYASYGGIVGIGYNATRIKKFVMGSCDDCIYIAITRSLLSGSVNDTLLVYNTKNRIWWAEDGAFSHLCTWETDTQTPFYYRTDYMIGSMYNNDVVIMNPLQEAGDDHLFNMTTRHFDYVPIEYAFETKTWTLNTVKQLKTLTNIWFQANAEGRVAVCDYWNQHNVWDGTVTQLDANYLILGNLQKVTVRHNVQSPTVSNHNNTEHQRFIIPRNYMQRINAFSVRVEGTGYAEFYEMEKEWRIK